jgi:hypothetical protein
VAQVFHRSTNTLSKLSIFGAAFLAAFVLYVILEVNRSGYVTRAGEVRDQPVPFSHQHHVGGLGIDCRYCHTSVEVSASAGLPPTRTCLNCHSQIWNQSPMLEPVRASFRTGESIEWVRVHDLPDFTYFNHSAHVNRGVGCTTCHGEVDRMPLMYQEKSLQMEWCLDCHRRPEKYVRPQSEVFNPRWTPPQEYGTPPRPYASWVRDEIDKRKIRPRTSCSTCHR